jgi:hypothetical protein
MAELVTHIIVSFHKSLGDLRVSQATAASDNTPVEVCLEGLAVLVEFDFCRETESIFIRDK